MEDIISDGTPLKMLMTGILVQEFGLVGLKINQV